MPPAAASTTIASAPTKRGCAADRSPDIGGTDMSVAWPLLVIVASRSDVHSAWADEAKRGRTSGDGAAADIRPDRRGRGRWGGPGGAHGRGCAGGRRN